ncbi:MAG: S8 family serine peptidase [Mycobacteriales bacterium]
MPQLDLTPAWAFDGADGTGVDVAVVDSGIDTSHAEVGDVASAVALSWDAEEQTVRSSEGPHEDLYGHGTACAGIIRRTAPGCRLHSVRVLGQRLSGKGPVFAEGLRRAMSVARVVNLSLSTGRPEYLALFHELADEAAFRGVVLVCAVNNAPTPSYPSQFSSVISVAANDGTGPYDVDCNPAPPVEFGAPGIGVTVPWLGGGSIVATGNSYAAPHVSGLVARLLSKHPELTPYGVKTVLRSVSRNAVPVRDSTTGGP